ncbi:MAG: carboxylesterase family protein [Roseburia sp.]|nr:carboxylesterase family protein [Roseburia sp.]
MTEHVVETKCGRVKGYQEKNVCIYRGIPYAKTERFELPKPYVWEGEFDATVGETDCYQYSSFQAEDSFYYHEFRIDREFTYAEDFMTLNIVAPVDAKNLPVLIFIHGGGHETGTVGEMPYGLCTEYAKRGIVYVSIGYRLNVFSLYDGRNFGLHDQIAATKWVHENIEAFGGDPSKITLMGQSAGAMSITDLMYCDKLKGIIQGAILMSGGGMVPQFAGPWTRERAKPFWEVVRKRAGVETEEEAKNVDVERLWKAWYEVSRESKGFQAIQPSIDGEIITDVPQKVLKARKELDVPIMVGVTSQDFLPVILYEVALGWGIDNHKKGKQPVYGYFFDRELPGNRFKAFHACDLWYMFGCMEQSWRPFEKIDEELAAEMQDYVANFVKNGNPNGAGLAEWKPLSKKNTGFRLFDGVSKGVVKPWKCRYKVWKTMLWDKGPM